MYPPWALLEMLNWKRVALIAPEGGILIAPLGERVKGLAARCYEREDLWFSNQTVYKRLRDLAFQVFLLRDSRGDSKKRYTEPISWT